VALALIATVTATAVPITAGAVDAGRARQAAAFLAGQLRLAKQDAVMRGASTGLVFDAVGGRWTFRVCTDGNANGLRRVDLRSGRDACAPEQVDLAAMFPGINIAVDPTIRGPDDDPPSGNAVRLGSSGVASFSPNGTCTSGSVFVRSVGGAQYVVRVAGVTGRLRVLRYDAASRAWRDA
jgi:type II secretory pathway pseudopilin PulG